MTTQLASLHVGLQEDEVGSFYAVYKCLVNAMSNVDSANEQAIKNHKFRKNETKE